jgi:ABC-type Fe3+-hydroxamate transport system substrate-binding protein
VAAFGLCAIALVTACGERSEPNGTAARLYPVTLTGAAGSPTTVEKRPQRILAADPAMATTLRALGIRPAATGERGRVPRGSYDLAVAWSSSAEAEALLRRSGSDVAVYVAPDRTLDDVGRSLADLGLLVGDPLAARRLVERIERQRSRVRRLLAGERPVTLFLDTGFFTTVSTRSLAGSIIAEAGGRNVAGPTPEPNPLDLEHLEQLDPTYYLATSDSETTLAGLRRSRRTRRLRAVRSGRFAIVPSSVLEPGPNVGLGVAEIARILHPDAVR